MAILGPSFGLYSHIRRNKWRTGFLLVGLFVLVLMVTFAIGLVIEAEMYGAPFGVLVERALGRTFMLAPFAALATGTWVMIGFAANTAIIASVSGAQSLERHDNPRLYGLMENLCISRGMSVPKLAIIESDALNAFASGVNDKQYTVTVTSGLMAALDDAELEGVLAHELTHIRNGDVRLMIVAVLIAGVLSFVGELMLRGGRFAGRSSGDGDRKGRGMALVLAAVIMILAGFLSVLIRLALSRSREYLADAGAVELTRNPDAMISALLKIAGRADIDGVPSGIMDMCIENDPDGFSDLFSTHPSIAKRIQALVQNAGGHVPDSQTTPRPPRVGERTALPSEVMRRGPWGPYTG
jgi:heat shock protein HtpX